MTAPRMPPSWTRYFPTPARAGVSFLAQDTGSRAGPHFLTQKGHAMPVPLITYEFLCSIYGENAVRLFYTPVRISHHL